MDTGTMIGIGVLIIVGGFVLFGIPYFMGLDDERITVEGQIIDVDIETKKDFAKRYDILTITFVTGERYVVKKLIYPSSYGYDMLTDFTVNSKIVMELFRPDDDSYWEIEHIYKVPDGVD